MIRVTRPECVLLQRAKYLAFLVDLQHIVPKKYLYPLLRLRLHPSMSQRDAVTLLQDQTSSRGVL